MLLVKLLLFSLTSAVRADNLPADSTTGDLSTASDAAKSPAGCYAACYANDSSASGPLTYVAVDGNYDCRCYTAFSGTALGDSAICNNDCLGDSSETCGSSIDFQSTLFSIYSEAAMLLHPTADGPGTGDSWATSATDVNQCGITGVPGSTVELSTMIEDNLLASDGSANTDNSDLTYQFDLCSGTVSGYLER